MSGPLSAPVTDDWGLTPSSKKKKKKQKYSAELTTSFWLPRLDEMVLLQPINTRSVEASKQEMTRVSTINEQLERYNRWLAFTQSAKSGKKARNAATELQGTVHELNELIASMMIKVDQKIADLQDSTSDFVDAIIEGGTWQVNGNLLNLTYEELDELLKTRSQHNSQAYKMHLCATVRGLKKRQDGYNVHSISNYGLDREKRTDKLLRLISEVEQCADGSRDAFHLLVFAKSALLQHPNRDPFQYGFPHDFSNGVVVEEEHAKFDTKIVELIKRSDTASVDKTSPNRHIYYDFASAAEEITSKLPSYCQTCTSPPPVPPVPPHMQALGLPSPPQPMPHARRGTFATHPDPFCARAPYLRLLQTVQQWAYGEILCGIMLTLGTRLPKELCLVVFDYAMQAYDLPLDPCVWEDDEYLVGMRICGAVKERYACSRLTSAW